MTQPNITPLEKRKYTIKMNKKSFFPLLSLQITVSFLYKTKMISLAQGN